MSYRPNWNTGGGGAFVEPVGAFRWYAGASGTPAGGWLECDGSVVAQATYAALFAVLGTTFNTGGEGAGNFRLPNLQRRTFVGAGGSGTGTLGNATGNTGGAETHALTTAELAAHTHVQNVSRDTAGTITTVNQIQTSGATGGGSGESSVIATDSGANTVVGDMSTDSTGSGTAHNIMQPSIVARCFVKT